MWIRIRSLNIFSLKFGYRAFVPSNVCLIVYGKVRYLYKPHSTLSKILSPDFVLFGQVGTGNLVDLEPK
jgi:hypothetical protein